MPIETIAVATDGYITRADPVDPNDGGALGGVPLAPILENLTPQVSSEVLVPIIVPPGKEPC